MQETQNSVRIDSEKTSIKRSARISSNEQKTAAENGDSEDLDQPNVKRMKPTKQAEDVSSHEPQIKVENEVADDTNITPRGPKLFPPESLNIVLQLSAGCRIGPNFDETKIRSLPPYEPLPYPEMFTRIVQDLIRCALRPEEVVSVLKCSAHGEPSTIITFFDRVKKKFECRNIPVVEDVNSAYLWLSQLLESVGCCKKLFLPDFLAEEFVCKQCFELNQGQRRGGAASGEEAASERHSVASQTDDLIEREIKEEKDDDDEEQRKEAEEEERKRIEEEMRKVAEEEKQNRVVEERLKEKLMEEQKKKKEEETKRWEEEERKETEEERRKAEDKKALAMFIPPYSSICSRGEANADDFKPDPDDDRFLLLPLQEACVVETGPFEPFNSGGPIDHLEFVENEASKRQREEEEWKRIEAETNAVIWSEEKKRMEEEAQKQKREAENAMIKAEKEREREKKEKNQSCKKEKRLRTEIWEFLHPAEETRAKNATELYNCLNSVFLILFKIPEERNELCPDLENTLISGSPDMSFTHDVRVNIYNDGGKEMWQLGEERAMDSSVLKKIISHSCDGHFSHLNVNFSKLDMWHSLLLHCPKCLTVSSVLKGLDRVYWFMRKEEKEQEEEKRS